jgi:hypothetical protein
VAGVVAGVALAVAGVGYAQPFGGMGSGYGPGMGMGMGMGSAMGSRSGPWGAIPDAPPQDDGIWHVAVKGTTSGPFDQAAMADMAAKGTLTAASWVWQPGADGWKRAGDTALSALFGAVPPPPPAE